MGKLTVPSRWLNYMPVGKPIPGTPFIAFKTPLNDKMNRKVPEGDRFDVPSLLNMVPDLGFVIDLTFTNRYYDRDEICAKGIKYKKITCRGQEVPLNGSVKIFFHVVDDYISKLTSGGKLIGVHCTHGLNRSGYYICRYMIQRLGFKPDDAVREFEAARGHQIERLNYVSILKGGNLERIDAIQKIAHEWVFSFLGPKSTTIGVPVRPGKWKEIAESQIANDPTTLNGPRTNEWTESAFPSHWKQMNTKKKFQETYKSTNSSERPEHLRPMSLQDSHAICAVKKSNAKLYTPRGPKTPPMPVPQDRRYEPQMPYGDRNDPSNSGSAVPEQRSHFYSQGGWSLKSRKSQTRNQRSTPQDSTYRPEDYEFRSERDTQEFMKESREREDVRNQGRGHSTGPLHFDKGLHGMQNVDKFVRGQFRSSGQIERGSGGSLGMTLDTGMAPDEMLGMAHISVGKVSSQPSGVPMGTDPYYPKETGRSGHIRMGSTSGLMGIGPTGPIGMGPTSPIGMGPTGPIGMGPTGPIGMDPTGPMGMGPTSPMGMGPTGPMGMCPTGPMGIGPSGSMGMVGPGGLMGMEGYSGPMGMGGSSAPIGMGFSGPMVIGPGNIMGLNQGGYVGPFLNKVESSNQQGMADKSGHGKDRIDYRGLDRSSPHQEHTFSRDKSSVGPFLNEVESSNQQGKADESGHGRDRSDYRGLDRSSPHQRNRSSSYERRSPISRMKNEFGNTRHSRFDSRPRIDSRDRSRRNDSDRSSGDDRDRSRRDDRVRSRRDDRDRSRRDDYDRSRRDEDERNKRDEYNRSTRDRENSLDRYHHGRSRSPRKPPSPRRDEDERNKRGGYNRSTRDSENRLDIYQHGRSRSPRKPPSPRLDGKGHFYQNSLSIEHSENQNTGVDRSDTELDKLQQLQRLNEVVSEAIKLLAPQATVNTAPIESSAIVPYGSRISETIDTDGEVCRLQDMRNTINQTLASIKSTGNDDQPQRIPVSQKKIRIDREIPSPPEINNLNSMIPEGYIEQYEVRRSKTGQTVEEMYKFRRAIPEKVNPFYRP